MTATTLAMRPGWGEALADEGPFIKMSVGTPRHPKIVAAGGDAAWLWYCALDWCAEYKTNGLIPVRMVPQLSDRRRPDRLARVLIDNDLWHEPGHQCKRCAQPLPGYYVAHDYLEHQRSAEQIAAALAAKEEGAAHGNHVRWHAARGRTDPDCRYCIASGSQEPSHNRSHMRSHNRSDDRSQNDRMSIADLDLDKDPPPTPPAGGERHRTRRQAYDYAGDQDFATFWQAYPVKSGKPAAYKAWLKALARGATAEHITAAAKRYRDDPRRDPEHTKYAQGWLNDERYNDEPDTGNGVPDDDFWER